MKTAYKLALAAVALAGLGGCAVYPAPGYGGYGYDGYSTAQPAVVEQSPVYIYGTTTYRNAYAQPRGYVAPPPRHYRRGYADQDRDGIPNRADRDRDGDGVPNRYDGRPTNPNRR
ncbi:MAG: thrombospondin type 3 repeat-containing protein [Pseudomonadota bacterium]